MKISVLKSILSDLSMKVKVTQSCLTLCNPMDYTIHGILQARILEWVAFPFSRGSSQSRDQTQVPTLQEDSLPAEPQLRVVKWSEVAQSCPTLCDSMDCSLPGSSLQGILPPWDFPGKSTGVGCRFLLLGIILTQGLNPDLPHSRQMLNLWATREATLGDFLAFKFSFIDELWSS